ncbi:substrate-binding domain-containing protein [Zophobihabitans entericus]|uniref:Substrate-binding domain-containing protein n=1 Tax=Zophobihabitans entericus TaxID=1635327 RepID=A0A6G9I992_9GAMM|nr:substrate-binding domain-containing protein [Zophobihabitans entericus]
MRCKIKISEQLAVIGFSDFSSSALAYPAISTIFIDKHVVGVHAADMLVDKIEGKAVEQKMVDVGFKLIARETT